MHSDAQRAAFSPPEPKPYVAWIVGSAASLTILGISVFLLQHYGLLDAPKDAPGGDRMAAALALVGSIIAAAVTLLGTVLKFSIDDRTARLAKIEADRNYALAVEADKRNRIDTAIRAVDLLSDNNQDSTPHQIGGALLALVSLGEYDLAVSLLEQLWPNNLASPTVAEAVLAGALTSGSAKTQLRAATVLFQHPERIRQKGFHIWPIQGGWRTDLSTNARIGLILAAGQWLKDELKNDTDSLPSSVIVLHGALMDPDAFIKDAAAACLRPVVAFYGPSYWTYQGDVFVSVKDIADRLVAFTGPANSTTAEVLEMEIQALLAPSAPVTPTAPVAPTTP